MMVVDLVRRLLLLSAVMTAAPGCCWLPDDPDFAGAPAATETLEAAPTGRPLASPRTDIPGLDNFAQVSPVLFRSAQPDAEGLRRAKQMGVRTVVNLRAIHSDRDELAGLGLRYVHIHCVPWHPEDEDVVRFLKVVKDPANQPVLVHCQHGADRTGLMVAAYRVVEEGWAKEDALQEFPRFGFHRIWGGLKRYLLAMDVDGIRARVKVEPDVKVDVVP